MTAQQISGSFSQEGIGFVASDALASPQPGWTSGFTAVQQLQIQPALTEQWSVLGWTMRIVGGLDLSGTPFGRLGALWGGLLVDTPLPSGSVPQFPNDLSTFAKLWDGATDPPFPQGTSPGLGIFKTITAAPLALTYMLPNPIAVQGGQQFQMALVLTPSLASGVQIVIASADYSVIYETG